MATPKNRPDRTHTVKEPKNRPKRAPVRRRRVLEAPEIKGFTCRWVNEELGAVEAMQDCGWSIVSGDDVDSRDPRVQDASQSTSVIRRVVNRSPHANTKTAVLMKIPDEDYKEIQAMKSEKNKLIERSIDPAYRQQEGSDYGEFKKS